MGTKGGKWIEGEQDRDMWTQGPQGDPKNWIWGRFQTEPQDVENPPKELFKQSLYNIKGYLKL